MPQHDLMQVIVPGWASFPPIRKWIDNLWNYHLWIFIGRTVDEAETPILWPDDEKNWLIGKDPDAEKNWGGGGGGGRRWDG